MLRELNRRQFLQLTTGFTASTVLSLMTPETLQAAPALVQDIPPPPHLKPGDMLQMGTNRFNDIYNPNYKKELEDLYRLNMKQTRVVVGKNDHSSTEMASELSNYLDYTEDLGFRNTVVMFNSFGDQDQYPEEWQKYYKKDRQDPKKPAKLGGEFYKNFDKAQFAKFVGPIIRKNKGRTGVDSWEICNEPSLREDPSSLIRFLALATEVIKDLDPDTLVTSGLLNTANTNSTPEAVYGSTPMRVTIHDHDNADREKGRIDAEWAKANGRSFRVDELGFPDSPNRLVAFREAINFWRSEGAEQIKIWGLPGSADIEDHYIIKPTDNDYYALRYLFQFPGV